MQITKNEHSCLAVDTDGATIVIDPGSFSGRLVDLEQVVAVVLTHEHPDHWTAEHVSDLHTRFPDAPILGPAGVAAAVAASSAGDVVEVVTAGQVRQVGDVRLEFFGGTHAEIHRTMPRVDNLGVLVDETVYHPGDSLVAPGVPVPLLAAPVWAPWLKIGEVMDFVTEVAAQQVIAIHDAGLSEAGMRLSEARVADAAEQAGGRYTQLRPGDVVTI